MKALLGLFLAFQVHATDRITLTTYNTVVFRGVVTDDSVQATQLEIIEQVVRRGYKTYPIYLVLDSPGGSIDAGLSFIEFTKTIDNLKTISIFAASMASAIVEALPGERLATQNGILMFHRAAGVFQGYFETGEVESRLWISKTMVGTMEKTNASRLSLSIADYKSLVQSEFWLYGASNTTYRAVDRLVDIVCTKQLIEKTNSVTMETLFSLLGGGSSVMKFSGCPLLRMPRSGSNSDVQYVVPSIRNYNNATSLILKPVAK